ncbi:MAG: hypothetical protein LBN33_03645, partial [Desulfovibrio sp.]|nr:hypothetical protein [Desulfovibrio sp.]
MVRNTGIEPVAFGFMTNNHWSKMKREKTQYPGVYYRLQNKPGSTAQEKVFYIFYRQEGKQ